MSRFEASDTVITRAALCVAAHIWPRAYAYPRRLGKYCGNRRWMQSWMVTTDRHGASGGST
jgi:hypothetical protein